MEISELFEKRKKEFKKNGIELKPLSENPVDEIRAKETQSEISEKVVAKKSP